MFTGIVTDIGEILEIKGSEDWEITIGCSFSLPKINIGTSIAHDGICLTVFEKGKTNDRNFYKVNISKETISKTNLSDAKSCWKVGSLINLERSLKIGDELGGHIVLGHVDGTASVKNIEPVGDSTKISLESPIELSKFITRKGSVTLNGTSLTVNDVRANVFDVNLIPHTKEKTNWKTVQPEEKINLEIDILARYVARLNEMNN